MGHCACYITYAFECNYYQGRIQGRGRTPGVPPPPKIGKNVIFWRKIVIFHTKYPKIVRASLRSEIKYLYLYLYCNIYVYGYHKDINPWLSPLCAIIFGLLFFLKGKDFTNVVIICVHFMQ
jgi:hypothetical protein